MFLSRYVKGVYLYERFMKEVPFSVKMVYKLGIKGLDLRVGPLHTKLCRLLPSPGTQLTCELLGKSMSW